MIRLICTVILALISSVCFSQNTEPPLKQVLHDLGFMLNQIDYIRSSNSLQGLFIKVEPKVEIILAAKYSFAKEPVKAKVRFGYYSLGSTASLHTLFECGSKVDGLSRISGLPATPRGPYRFVPPPSPLGFFVQSANFNPTFSTKKETVYTQDKMNKPISRFGGHIHKARIYPYKTKSGIKRNWYVICWEFTDDNDYQDLVTVVRGVKLIQSPKKKIKQKQDVFDRYDIDKAPCITRLILSRIRT
jgi:hypothetical protein